MFCRLVHIIGKAYPSTSFLSFFLFPLLFFSRLVSLKKKLGQKLFHRPFLVLLAKQKTCNNNRWYFVASLSPPLVCKWVDWVKSKWGGGTVAWRDKGGCIPNTHKSILETEVVYKFCVTNWHLYFLFQVCYSLNINFWLCQPVFLSGYITTKYKRETPKLYNYLN